MVNKRPVLAVDNSLMLLNLALGEGEDLVEERRLSPSRHTSEVIAAEVGALLKGHGMTPRDLSLVIVTLGPGSFTGIRVALAFCKGLRAGTGVDVTGVSTLDILARPLAGFDAFLCPLIDARKGEVFAALYSAGGGRTEKVLTERALKPADVPSFIRTPCLCFGTGASLCGPALRQTPGVTVLGDGFNGISGEILLKEGLKAREEGASSGLAPIYGRRSEAEIAFGVTAL